MLETVREGPRLVAALRRAAEADIPVVLLPVGGSPLGSALVTAHSGALAGERAAWEALAEGTGALLVSDLAELTDTLELLAIGRRARHWRAASPLCTTRAPSALWSPTSPTSSACRSRHCRRRRCARLDELLDDGLLAENPLDLWGTGAATRELFGESLRAMAADPAVSAVALAIDLVEEYDGDTSYVDAALDYDGDVPLVVLTNLAVGDRPERGRTAAQRPAYRCSRAPAADWSRCDILLGAVRAANTGDTAGSRSIDASVGSAGRPGWTTRARSTAPNRSRCSADYGVPVVDASRRGERGRRRCCGG